MRFNGYHHIGLMTSNIERSLKFYTEGLGGEVIFSFPMPANKEKVIYLVDLGGNAVVELIPNGVEDAEINAKFAHICLATDDVPEAFNAAIAAGARVRSEPTQGFLGTMERVGAFVFGPDDEVIEFFHVISQ